MKMRLFLLLLSVYISGAVAHDPSISNAGPVLNKDGSVVTGIITAEFNPSAGLLPFPHNLFFNGTGDLTLNIPITSTNPNDPAVGLTRALNSLDGFSTTEKWIVNFKRNCVSAGCAGPASIDPASVIPGHSVRVFQVTTQQIFFVTGVVRELVAGVDFFATAAPGGIVAIIPLKPLPELSTFMVVLTNDIRDTDGNDATPDNTYYLSQSHTPWVDAAGKSTYPLIDDASARSVEGLRQMTNTMEAAAAAAGVDHEDIVLSYTITTQGITPTLKLLRSIAQPSPVIAAPTGLNTSLIGAPGIADIVIGVITLPYYLGIPSAANPIAPLTDFWTAPPGGYIPPFDQAGFDPTSTHVTKINPFPVLTGMQTVPLVITVPNANSGHVKPPGGWPVVIYQHGITRNRTDALAIADSLAKVGYAVVSMDQPLHGVVPAVAPSLAPFYIENTPFGPLANERTFDADYFNNATGAQGPDGITDSSGTSSFNLANLRTARDNLRQATADLSILALSLQNISVDGDQVPDLNPFNVGLVTNSLGTTVGIGLTAIEPIISRAYLNAATGSLIRTGLAGSFGDQVNAGLAAAGILQGTALYEQFVTVAQTVVDSGDGINWAAEAVTKMPVIHNMVLGDTTVPNAVPGAPVAGGQAVNVAMGLVPYSTSQANPDGLRGVAKFLPPAFHESLFRPVSDDPPFTVAPQVTAEMQGQMASFIASGGTFVLVSNPDVLSPVINLSELLHDQPDVNPNGGKQGKGSGGPASGASRVTALPNRKLGGRK